MKVLAVCSSPRTGGNTQQALEVLLDVVASHGIETELVTMAGRSIRGCSACMKCKDKQDGLCHGIKDDLNPIIEKCLEADALVFGSPVYFGSATPEMKCLIDRLGYATKSAKENRLYRKIGGAVTVARRAGQNFTFAQISFFFSIMGMIQVGSSYWNVLSGREKGEIRNDEEGIATIKNYGENLAWTLKKLGNE